MKERRTPGRVVAAVAILFAGSLQLGDTAAADEAVEAFDQLLDSFPVVDEIDATQTAPTHEFPAGGTQVVELLGQSARLLPMGDGPVVAAWVIGKGKGLRPGDCYVLEVEYPDDEPRTVFVANRGADQVRGFATGAALGDARQQYVQPSVESISYPHSGRWRVYRSIFFLHERFQGIYAQREPKAGGRPFGRDDGFHVIVFQTKHLNDPRSAGAAVGRIRLRHVPDPAALYADVEPLPEGLPKRRIFYREEMADEPISGKEAADRAVDDPVDWYVYKARLNRMLGINTFAKDLLEFGHNQGWDAGNGHWYNNAQPPLTDLWGRLAPRVAGEGLDLLPYYEYKGGIGWEGAEPKSLGLQRRATKLYHNDPNTEYTGVWWTEAHNADLTDPETLADAKRVLDRTIIDLKGQANFAGAWVRVRDNHLPVSFSDATIARFREDFPADADAQGATRDAIKASYEGDRKLYNRYIDWWLGRRAAFFAALREHIAQGLGDESVKLLFTPWTTEQIPTLRDFQWAETGTPVQVATDDPAWWDAFAKQVPGDSWFRWALVPTAWDDVVKRDLYRQSIEFREPVSPLPWRSEPFHSAPNADPGNYRQSEHVMLSFPAGRLFTVARPELLEEYRTGAGLTVIRHYTLNEDSHDYTKGPSDLPFDGQVGYVCADVDRAGPYVRLMEARAVAAADPTNLGYLCASAFSTGEPAYVRQFNRAFLSLPALPSTVVGGASPDEEVVVRQIVTEGAGTYYLVVNTSLRPKGGVRVELPAQGGVRDLLDGRNLDDAALTLDLHPGELRTYRAAP